MKRLFVIVAASVFGVTLALGAVLGGWLYWENRPQPRDAHAVIARYEQPVLKGASDDRSVEFRYVLRNTTNRDVYLSRSNVTVYAKRKDGSIGEIKSMGDAEPVSTDIPAGESVIYLIKMPIKYATQKDCAVQPVGDPTADQLREFVSTCYKNLAGFEMLTSQLRIDMPFKAPADSH